MVVDVDLACVLLLFGAAFVVGVGYSIRRAQGREARYARVAADGGSALLGQGTMSATFWLMDLPLRACEAAGVTPDGVTWASLALAAGVAFGAGHVGVGALLAVLSTLCDLLDGQLARRLGVSSDRGEVLDASVDRVGEFAFFGGIAVAYREQLGPMVLSLLALQGASLVSYATAKAEALRVAVPRGLMRRPERAAYLLVGASSVPVATALAARLGLPAMLGQAPLLAALALIAALANYSAVVRLVQVARSLPPRRAPAPSPEAPKGEPRGA